MVACDGLRKRSSGTAGASKACWPSRSTISASAGPNASFFGKSATSSMATAHHVITHKTATTRRRQQNEGAMTKSAAHRAKSGAHHISKRKREKLARRQVTEFDPNGIQVIHHRTVDTLRLMLDSRAITPAMHDAARDFQAAFTIACFDSMPRVNLTLMARSPSPA